MNISITNKKLNRYMLFLAFFNIISFVSDINGQVCGSNLDLVNLRRNSPIAYKEHLRIEKLTQDYLASLATNPNARLITESGVITIPVVFHILHKGEQEGIGTNISDARIISQMTTLNQCFSQSNPDLTEVLSFFQNKIGNPNFQFRLACKDPNGYSTSGIIRRSSNTNFYKSEENIKQLALGGDDAWPTDRFLNIWVAPDLDPDLYGYATWPHNYTSKPNNDGVVVRYDVVGVNTGNLPGYTEGRALVHEIGHWLDLFHTFEGACDVSGDHCTDTPCQGYPTYSITPCATVKALATYQANTCGDCNPNDVMYDNFMDYTNDQCGNHMFTKEQVSRMRATFQPGGPRRSFIDNYFKLYTAANCGLYFVQTPFCNAEVTWSATPPVTVTWNNWLGGSHLGYVNIPNNFSGEVEITASWNNYIDSKKFVVGYGSENSTYNPNYQNSGNRPLYKNSVSMTSYNNWTYGQVNFATATGVAKNWRLKSSSSPTYISTGNSNNFSIYLTQPYALATIQADIPTDCGDKTVEYSFLGGYLNLTYEISPNPSSHEITISAFAPSDPNNRTASSNTPAYEVQIFNSFNQLMKKKKASKNNGTITIDISNFPSNQFYTVKLISDNDVQTKSFFKQ